MQIQNTTMPAPEATDAGTKTEGIDSVNSTTMWGKEQGRIKTQLKNLRSQADREITMAESALSQKNRRKARYHKRMAIKCMVKIAALSGYGGALNG